MSKSFTPPKPVPAPTGYLDRRNSAAYLSVSTRYLDAAASSGEITRIKHGRKTVFAIAELDRFAESKIQRLEVEQ